MDFKLIGWAKEASFIYAMIFIRGMKTTLIFQSALLLIFHAFIYVIEDSGKPSNLFLNFGFEGFVFFALNGAFIYMMTLIIFRGLISPLIFMITTVVYAAAVKYYTGSLFFGLDVHDFRAVLPTGLYLYFMTYLDGLMNGEIETAITYRTRSDDD